LEIKAIFVDAANTLLQLKEPVGVTYTRFARQHGLNVDPVLVQQRFKLALKKQVISRQHKDGRSYWRPVVAEALGIEITHATEPVFENLYQFYASPKAWWVDIEALQVLGGMARKGIYLGIISNFDGRLRQLYQRFALDRMFPYLICSAEHGVEKPDPLIFKIACRCVGVSAPQAVHIGDDWQADIEGARQAGLRALHYEEDGGWRKIEHQLSTLKRHYLI
jgi:putative hydrolase of the HAD superfamily